MYHPNPKYTDLTVTIDYNTSLKFGNIFNYIKRPIGYSGLINLFSLTIENIKIYKYLYCWILR